MQRLKIHRNRILPHQCIPSGYNAFSYITKFSEFWRG